MRPRLGRNNRSSLQLWSPITLRARARFDLCTGRSEGDPRQAVVTAASSDKGGESPPLSKPQAENELQVLIVPLPAAARAVPPPLCDATIGINKISSSMFFSRLEISRARRVPNTYLANKPATPPQASRHRAASWGDFLKRLIRADLNRTVAGFDVVALNWRLHVDPVGDVLVCSFAG